MSGRRLGDLLMGILQAAEMRVLRNASAVLVFDMAMSLRGTVYGGKPGHVDIPRPVVRHPLWGA